MPTKMIWLLPMWSNAGSRMFPRFFPHLTISLSQALGQRTAKRLKVLPAFSKAAGCRAEPYGLPGVRGSWCPVGTVQDRSTLPLRSVLGVCHWQTAPEAAAETRSHRLPILPKRGDVCPPLGVAPRPGFLLVEGAGRVPPRPLQRLPPLAYAPLALHFFHRLRRLRPWSAAPHLASL